MAGVGTLTFYDPQTNMFASLGHPITDVDTKERLDLKDGEIIRSDIIDVRPGIKGEPGELKGMFDENGKKLGVIKYNNDFGIYGNMYQPITNRFYPNGLEIGAISDVHPGNAKILTTIDNTGIQAFDCSIIKIAEQDYPTSKGMVLQITDSKLLGKTGGIVQGMSGSPIIQDNKIVGCVTHVFVNDPTKGYGLFINWMVEQMDR
jgi:stage IV sporulation protein B